LKILVLCPHPPDRAPGQRLKFEQYYPSWRNAGHQVDVRPFWSERVWDVLYQPGHRATKVAGTLDGCLRRLRDLRDARRVDLVYLFLEALPVGPPVIERLIARAGVPVVYDIDDLVYLPHSSSQNQFMRRLRGREKFLELMALADEVIVCTDHLRGFAEERNDRVTNISSTIDTVAYVPRPHRPRTTGVVIGWSGSHSTSPYLRLLADVLRELQRSDGITVKVIGDESFRIDGLDVDARPWTLDTEVEDLSEIDIGVYPLPEEEWVLGKSGLKALQYMALEIPPVAQRIGSNIEIVRDGENGFLAESKEEWLDRLRRLVRDPQLRRRMGVEARKTVVSRYSVAANEGTYLRVIEAARQNRSRPARTG
jgi:glycosyltransferase involved in cell wall biosynthesis